MIDATRSSLANDTQSGMLREISEPALSRPNRSSFLPVVIGALALALPLSACGRRGGLDPPPGGSRLEAGAVRTPVTRRGVEAPVEKPPEYDEDGRPITPAGSRKKLPADWLID
jgi:Prokaryotic lipoprotein-attachment site